MTTGSFPADSSARKVILVLQQHDLEKCAYEPGAGEALLDDEAYVLPFPLQKQKDQPIALQNICDSDLVRPGVVLVQSPYDPDSYEDASLAPQKFALAKHMYFSNLCMLLGAKEVSVEQIDLHTHSKKLSINANGEIQGKEAKGGLELAELEKLRTQMHLHDDFSGGSPDVQGAERLLRRIGLWSDPSMKNLVEMRREGGNQLLSRKIKLSLSSESKNNFNVIGRINLPKFVKLTADYARIVDEKYEYTLTIMVKF